MRRDSPGSTLRTVLVFSAAVAALATTAWAGIPSAVQKKLARVNTPYYVIYTDLPLGDVREAAVRLTAMAEEYHERTKGFSGAIRSRLPFYLFRQAADYYLAGGPVGSVGVFRGSELMAIANPALGGKLWHVLQHEGFHQFAHFCISRRLPVWVNEGLAEYFGEGIWTGDGFVTGVLPSGRVGRVKKLISGGGLAPFEQMLTKSLTEWNEDLNIRNYDQAWSMVHFLVHAADGRYRNAFSGFVNDIARHRPWKQSFAQRFGTNVEAFQKTYEKWWLDLPADAGRDLYTQTVVRTLTSYLARAASQGQTFDDAEAFFQAAREDQLKARSDQWLPPALLAEALEQAGKREGWSLEKKGSSVRLVLTEGDGTKFIGRYELAGKKVRKVGVEIIPSAATSQPASKGAGKED